MMGIVSERISFRGDWTEKKERYKAWLEKVMHGQFKRQTQKIRSEESWMWLQRKTFCFQYPFSAGYRKMAQNTESSNIPYKSLQQEDVPAGPPPSYPQAQPYPQPYPEGQPCPTSGFPLLAPQPQNMNVSMDNTVFSSWAVSFYNKSTL